MTRPGWQRLYRHSYSLGWRWLAGGWRHGWSGARVGLCRLLVPLDPWRFYEMGKAADDDYKGRCLDVSSPKLLPSLLRREGRGDWTAIDLHPPEIEAWRRVDPALRLDVEDARRLPFPDATFDHCLSISVVEHLAGEDDAQAMAEIWRVLKPGGVLHLTTNVSPVGREVWHDEPAWGAASTRVGQRYFFERHYSPADLDRRLLADDWRILEREYCRQRDPAIETRFHRRAPLSYLWGGWLRTRCPQNFVTSPGADVLDPEHHGVVYLRLRKI